MKSANARMSNRFNWKKERYVASSIKAKINVSSEGHAKSETRLVIFVSA